MAETPLTDSIEALTTYANQVTGASDTNLSDAVYTLAQGYGGGGNVLLLDRVEAEQGFDGKILQVDFPSNYADYDFFITYNHGATDINEWLYYPFNQTATTSEYTATQAEVFKDIVNVIYKSNGSYIYKLNNLDGNVITMQSNNFICMRTYNAGKILPGSYIELYGIKLN